MKTIYGMALVFLSLLAFNAAKAQTNCAGITVEAVPMNPQTGQYNYFGVRVTLDQAYEQDITVLGTISAEGTAPANFSVTVPSGNLNAETLPNYYQTAPVNGEATIATNTITPSGVTKDGVTYSTQCNGTPPSEVSVNDNRLKFGTLALYVQYASNELDRSIFVQLSAQSGALTTMAESSNGIEDDLYAEFLTQILNTDHIMEVGSFLIKLDLENHRALVINSSNANAYQTLVTNDLGASGLMIFTDDVDNAIEVLEAIENGSLQVSNYQTAIQSSSSNARSCPGAHDNKDTEPNRPWARGTDPNSQCPDLSIILAMDNKVVYQRFIIYFSLESKIRSIWGCSSSNWILAPFYNEVDVRLVGTARYSKRCENEITVQQTDYHTGPVLHWRPYESTRSLSAYDFTVTFGIRLTGSGQIYTNSRPYHIQY